MSREIFPNPKFGGPCAQETRTPLSGDILIRVGPPRTEYVLCQKELCDTSQYFRNMMRSGFEESASRIVELPDDDPEIFDIYAQWQDTGLMQIARKIQGEFYFDYFGHAYVMGEKLQDCYFKNAVMHSYFNESMCQRWIPNAPNVSRVFDATPPGSVMRSVLVDQIAYYPTEDWFNDIDSDSMNTDLLIVVVKGMSIRRKLPCGAPPDRVTLVWQYVYYASEDWFDDMNSANVNKDLMFKVAKEMAGRRKWPSTPIPDRMSDLVHYEQWDDE